jgi:hypothetical protein
MKEQVMNRIVALFCATLVVTPLAIITLAQAAQIVG